MSYIFDVVEPHAGFVIFVSSKILLRHLLLHLPDKQAHVSSPPSNRLAPFVPPDALAPGSPFSTPSSILPWTHMRHRHPELWSLPHPSAPPHTQAVLAPFRSSTHLPCHPRLRLPPELRRPTHPLHPHLYLAPAARTLVASCHPSSARAPLASISRCIDFLFIRPGLKHDTEF